MNRANEAGPVIVLGMHRSGSTLLASALSKLGVFMGFRLDRHHEARFFRKLNDWALSQAGATWDHPESFDSLYEFQRKQLERVLRRHLRGLRRLEYLGPVGALSHRSVADGKKPWGWKDPRNTFVADLWLKIFPSARILHIHRHPIAVAASLRQRERRFERDWRRTLEVRLDELRLRHRPLYGASVRVRRLEEGVELWCEYVEKAMSLDTPAGILPIRFESLLEEPEDHLTEIAEFLNLRVPAGRIAEVASSVDPTRAFAWTDSEELSSWRPEPRVRQLMARLDYAVPTGD